MRNNFMNYNTSYFSKSMYPSFINVIKPKKSFTSKLLSKDSISSIEGIINGAQKMIKIYDQAMPIVNEIKPMIGNIKTTFKVARAFKKFSNESPLEKAFDNLPDFDKQESVKEEVKLKKVANPFYP